MDLSFSRFDRPPVPVSLPADLPVVLAAVAARAAASPTAAAQAAVEAGVCAPEPQLLQPSDGAFNGVAASVIRRWSEP